MVNLSSVSDDRNDIMVRWLADTKPQHGRTRTADPTTFRMAILHCCDQGTVTQSCRPILSAPRGATGVGRPEEHPFGLQREGQSAVRGATGSQAPEGRSAVRGATVTAGEPAFDVSH